MKSMEQKFEDLIQKEDNLNWFLDTYPKESTTKKRTIRDYMRMAKWISKGIKINPEFMWKLF
jgi:hypothetical protein